MSTLRNTIRALRVLNLPCREQAKLHSLELDGQLTPPERLAVKLHALYCLSCRRNRRQFRLLREMTRSLGDQFGTSLDQERAQRILRRFIDS